MSLTILNVTKLQCNDVEKDNQEREDFKNIFYIEIGNAKALLDGGFQNSKDSSA